MTAPVALGSRRELFVDRFLVDRLEGAALHLHPPERREVVFQVSQPWESACTACYNLVQEGDRTLLYYRGFYPIGEDYADGAASQTTNLAVSRDGIRFEHPELGRVEFAGTRRNNVLIQGHESHNFCVFLDSNPDRRPGAALQGRWRHGPVEPARLRLARRPALDPGEGGAPGGDRRLRLPQRPPVGSPRRALPPLQPLLRDRGRPGAGHPELHLRGLRPLDRPGAAPVRRRRAAWSTSTPTPPRPAPAPSTSCSPSPCASCPSAS